MFTLHNGDCLQVMPSIPSGSIDAIITDLPYGTTACKWDTIIPFEPMWKEVKRVLKPNGAFITTASQPFTSILILSNLEWFRFENIWDKVQGTDSFNAKRRPMKSHENIAVFCEGNPTYNPQMVTAEKKNMRDRQKHFFKGSSGGVYGDLKPYVPNKDESLRYPVSVFRYSNQGAELHKDKRIHSTQKPVALYEYLIKTYTNEGETVLDICMGSGTTIEAAERTGRNSIGIEKDEGIFQSAVLRLKSLTPSNNRLHWTGGDSPALPSQSTLEGFTAPEADTTPPASQ